MRSETNEVRSHTTSSGCPAGATMSGRILIVTGEAAIRDILTDHLRAIGFEIVAAADGIVGMEILRQWQIKGILMDIEMPAMNGLTMLQQLQLQHAHVPVIMISTAENKQKLEMGLKAGAMDYILKPLNLELLTYKCQRLFA